MEETYTSEEIRQLILYVKEMQDINEDLRAGIIAMQAKLNNEESKVKQLRVRVQQLQYLLNNGASNIY